MTIEPKDKGLEDLLPVNVQPINNSSNAVMVNGSDGRGLPTTLEISVSTALAHQSIIVLYITYLKKADFLKKSPSTRYSTAIDIRNFVNFIEQNIDELGTPLPKDLFKRYFSYLRKESNRTSLYNIMLHLRRPLKDYQIGRFESPLTGEGDLMDYLSNMPNETPPESQAKTSMAMLFEKDCPYTDRQLVISLRLLCCLLLEKCLKIKEYFFSNKDVKVAIEELINQGYINSHLSRKFNFERPKNSYDDDEWLAHKKAAEALLQAISKTEDPFVKEMFLEGTAGDHFPEGIGEQDKLERIFDYVVTPQKRAYFKLPSRRMFGEEQGFMKRCLIRFRTLGFLTPRFVAGITDVECFLMQCLLSSESIQRSALSKHRLDDFSLKDTGIQSQYKKNRRKRASTTGLYKTNTLIYQAYERYVNCAREMQDWLPEKHRGKTLFYSTENVFGGAIGSHLPSLDLLTIICKKNSYIRYYLMEETGGEVEPILWLLERIANANIKQKLAKGKIKKSSSVKNRTMALNCDVVSMSRKRMDDSFELSLKSENKHSSTNAIEDERVAAELTGHSQSMKKNTYNLRSNSKEKLASLKKFGQQVGESMEEDASRIKAQLERSKVVSLKELRVLLGFSDQMTKVEDLLSEIDASIVQVWGGVTISHNTYVIANSTTGMLLWGYINHIKRELPRLRNDSELKANEATLQLAYMNEIFYQFPSKVKQESQDMFKEYDITYPSLI